MEILVLIIVAAIIVYFVAISAKKEEEETEERGKRLESSVANMTDSLLTSKIIGLKNHYVFGVDEVNSLVIYISENEETKIPFDEIINVELVENNTTVASKSSMRTIGGALVGGALAGGAGTIVGGLSGDTKMKKKISLISVKLRLRDITNPVFVIECFNAKRLTGSTEVKSSGMFGDMYKKGLEDAQMITDVISVIIDKVDRENRKSNNPESGNVTDELLKLANLKDRGILSEEEFSKQKSRLLS